MVRKHLLAWATTAFMGVSLLAALSAQASMYNFSYSGTGVNASGVLTVAPSGPNYLITGISGTYNGSAITSLFAPGGFQGNDNLLLSGSPQLTILGFAFSVAGLGTSVDVYHDAAGQFICAGCYGSYSEPGGDTVINFSASPVPIPAAVWLLASGLIGLVGIGRRRRAA